jgi:hypothetical protein
LIASAIERSRAGRVGIYDVTVTDLSGVAIAEFFGHSRLIGGAVIADDAEAGTSRSGEMRDKIIEEPKEEHHGRRRLLGSR